MLRMDSPDAPWRGSRVTGKMEQGNARGATTSGCDLATIPLFRLKGATLALHDGGYADKPKPLCRVEADGLSARRRIGTPCAALRGGHGTILASYQQRRLLEGRADLKCSGSEQKAEHCAVANLSRLAVTEHRSTIK